MSSLFIFQPEVVDALRESGRAAGAVAVAIVGIPDPKGKLPPSFSPVHVHWPLTGKEWVAELDKRPPGTIIAIAPVERAPAFVAPPVDDLSIRRLNAALPKFGGDDRPSEVRRLTAREKMESYRRAAAESSGDDLEAS